MKLNYLADEVNIVDFISKEICDNCMIKRQQRKINRTFKIRANEFLDICQSDSDIVLLELGLSASKAQDS